MSIWIEFENRILKNYKYLKKWIHNNNIEAYRLYDKDIPRIPIIIDIYNDYAHIQEYYNPKIEKTHEEDQEWITNIKKSVNKVLGISFDKQIFKIRSKQKGKNQYEKLTNKDCTFVIKENGYNFSINLTRYLDTGLFLDHRNMRMFITQYCHNKKILNLFSYTASFTVYAAKSGAVYSESVDLSKTYSLWAKNNLELNNIDINNHKIINQDVFEYLLLALENKLIFDLIILDPPSFSNSKKMHKILDIQKDHLDLINSAMKLLTKEGKLLFSTNLKNFKLDNNLFNRYLIKDLTTISIPKDFRNHKIHYCYLMTNKKDQL